MDAPNFIPLDHTVSPTLYAALITANQTLYYNLMSSNKRTGPPTDYPIPITVLRWNDFNIQSLTEAYGDILSSNLDIRSSESYSDPIQISGPDSLKSACESHVFRLIHQAIIRGTEDIVGRLEQRMPNVEYVQDDRIPHKYEYRYKSGLSVLLGNPSISTPPARLVVSCFYHASTWKSGYLLSKSPRPFHLLPLQRLAMYCLLADTRYGFIFTGLELVVVRVSGTIACPPAPCQVEWQSIPWSNSGPGVLTVKLSLWSLIMMSLHKEYRATCTPERILPLHLWWRYRNCEGRVVFRHHLSMREVFELPNGAVFQDVNLIL
jgi:hypothetical protein